MRFWQKIFIPVLILFLVLLNGCIYILYSITYQNNLDSEKTRTTSEQYALSVALSRDFSVLEENEMLQSDSVRKLMNTYGAYYDDGGVYLRLYEQETVIYQSDSLPLQELAPGEVITAQYDGLSYACASDRVLNHGEYRLVYIRDITQMEQTWDELLRFVTWASLIVSAVLGILLYFIIRHLARPITKLAKAADQVAEGNYDAEVPFKGKDEIATLTKNFNHMTAQIGQHVQQLEAESTKKQMFMDNFTHELRTPLTNIYGYSEFMMRVAISEDDRLRYLDYIMRESKRLNIMSTELFNLTVLRNNEVEMKMSDCQSLMEAAAETLQEKLRKKDMTLTVLDSDARVYGSWALIESLIINFSENAIRACEPGGKICLSFTQEDGKTVLRVKDNGKGMDSEQIAHITEPFYRVDKARTRANGGVGLGLYLCSEIVRVHGANLRFESELGKGTEVIVEFPQRR